MKLPEINENIFYSVGQFAFFSIALMGILRVANLWGIVAPYDIIASLASTLFYFALAFFFGYLKKKSQTVEVNDGDIFKMNEALDNLNLGEEKNAKKGSNNK